MHASIPHAVSGAPLMAISFAAMTATSKGLITAGLIIAAAFVAGLMVERTLGRALRRLAANTEGKIDDVIAASLKGTARWAFLLAGVYYSIQFLPLPASIDEHVTSAGRVAVMLLAVVMVARFASGIAVHYAHRVVPSSASLAKIVVNAAVFLIGLLVIFQTMGVQVAPIITALGIGGLAVALALQSTLGNFFAGIQILAQKELHTGDYVVLDGGQEGYVLDVGWRATTLRMLGNNLVIVPNTKLVDAIIVNYALPSRPFSVLLQVSVAYGSDLGKVERVAIDVAREVSQRVEGAVKDFTPLVRFHTFGESGVNFTLVAQSEDVPAQHVIKHELVKALHQRFAAEGIEIPFPVRTVYLRDRRS